MEIFNINFYQLDSIHLVIPLVTIGPLTDIIVHTCADLLRFADFFKSLTSSTLEPQSLTTLVSLRR